MPAKVCITSCLFFFMNALLGSLLLKADKPLNIILMVADDLGYGDVSLFRTDGPPPPSGSNRPLIFTPQIDGLGKNGLILTDFYANCSVCSPTRAAIMTGRYQHRSGIANVLSQTANAFSTVYPEADQRLGLRTEETTIAEAMLAGGYRTGMIGKWHLGHLEEPGGHPMDHGFEHFLGVQGSGGNFFSMIRNGRSILYRGRERVAASGEYWTYVQAQEGLAFIDQPDERPFFLYIAFNAPHGSSRVGPGDREAANQWDHRGSFRTDYSQVHKELVEALDEAVGMIREGLEERGLLDNTLIIFTSDNGQTGYGFPPFSQRLGKQTVYEGGVRVPTVMHWPAGIEAGRVSSTPKMTMDLMPTFLGLTGIALPEGAAPLDGLDLSSFIKHGGEPEHRLLFWEKPYQVWMEYFENRIFAVRDGDWKLVRSHINRPLELYNLKQDQSETHDLAGQYPERVAQMKQAFEVWRKDVWSDAPYDLDDFILRLREHEIVTDETTNEERDGY
jgi:arylsulfatase A